MSEPLISVIMGVYNPKSKTVLDCAVNSILNQSYSNLEFIICDDGSNVATKSWLRELEKIDERIIVLRNEKNIGLAASLNYCIQNSNGEYIARQDADDYSPDNRLEKQVQFLEKNLQYAFVGSNIKYFSENGVWGEFTYPNLPVKNDFLWGSPFCHGSVMFRKQILQQVCGYRVSRETLRCEDFDLFMRIYEKNNIAANLQEYLYYFCENEDTEKRRKFLDRILEVRVRLIRFRELGLYPKGVLFSFKPIVVGLIPKKLLHWIKNVYYQRNY